MRRIHALTLIPLFALAACSSPAATPASPETSTPSAVQPTAPASTGETLTGTGFTLTLPENWKDATAEFRKLQAEVDTGAKRSGDTKDGFNDNVNIIVRDSPSAPFDQLQDALKSQLEAAGSTNIQFKDTTRLDGAEAMQVWSHTKGTDAGTHTIQFLAFNDGKLFVVTVSTNLGDAKADALAQQLISGWKWA